MADFKPLRLKAEDGDDLTVVSAALQDAVGQLGDFSWDSRARRFRMLLNRYRWEAAGDRGKGERVRTALQVDSVLSVRSRNVKQTAPDAVVSLLALAFERKDDDPEAPEGTLVVTLAGGGDIRIEVECVDVILADVSEPWRARARPAHETGPETRTGTGPETGGAGS